MREVTAERFVSATTSELDAVLTPRRVLAYEGTFTVESVTETDDGWTVTARAPGMTVTFDFEERERGVHYAQRGEAGPFESMATTISHERKDDGSVVRATSSVSLGLPLAAVSDRIAAWKRRGELRRALDELAAEVG